MLSRSGLPQVMRNGATLAVSVGAGTGHVRMLLVGYGMQHQTLIHVGENGGRTILEINIVRFLARAAVWNGAVSEIRHIMPAGEGLAVILQSENRRIIGATRLNKPMSRCVSASRQGVPPLFPT